MMPVFLLHYIDTQSIYDGTEDIMFYVQFIANIHLFRSLNKLMSQKSSEEHYFL